MSAIAPVLSQIPLTSNLIELLDYRAEHQPTQLAYEYLRRGETVETQLTYRELRNRAVAIAHQLIDINQNKAKQQASGGRALLVFSPGLDFVAAFLGCLYAGVTAVPAYPPRKNQKMLRLQAIVKDAEATAVLTTADLANKIGRWFDSDSPLGSIPWLSIDKIDHSAATAASSRLSSSAALTGLGYLNPLAFLQYTSGSTGTPKGVMVSQQNLMHNLAAIYRCFGHSSESKGVIWLPPYHDMGLIGGVLQPLYGGFPVTLMSPVDFLQKPLRWLKAISQQRATTSGGPNFAYDLCVEKMERLQSNETSHQLSDFAQQLDLSSWQVAFTGAEPVRIETLNRFAETFVPYGFRREAFYPCYGMAETTLIVSGGAVNEPPVTAEVKTQQLNRNRAELAEGSETDIQTLVGCGQSLGDQQVVIVHPETRIACQAKEIGEIWVAGESVAEGYWRNPEETVQAFGAHIADTGAGPYLRTGDLGFLVNSELFVTGRIKDMMIIRGQNHYPQDIERTLEASHPAVKASASAAFSIIQKAERLVIVSEIERTFLRNLDVCDVSNHIRRAITAAHDLQVYAIVLVKPGSIPKTSSGKIQRYRCRELFLSGELAVVGDWSESPKHKREFSKIQDEVDALLQSISEKL